MFADTHFYHRTIRRCVVAFGNLFNQIQLVKYEKGTFNEVERTTVPISYSANENYAQRLLGNPELPAAVQIKLPRMSFELTSVTYDPARKLSTMGIECATVNGDKKTVSTPSPYDLGFELNIYVRNMEDGTQIVEQILPFFNPEYTMAMTYIDDMNLVRNLPINLDSITHSMDYEGDNQQVRMVTWKLTFTMKAYFYGPVTGNTGIIRTATANSYLMQDSTNKDTGEITTSNTLVYGIVVTPDPIDAGPDDAYGFDTLEIDYVDESANT